MAISLVVIGVAPVVASVVDVTIADVTPRAFTVVWVSSEPVTTATVRVFNDAGGTAEITANLVITLVSASFPPALERGVVKVAVAGVSANSDLFVQTVTTGAGGSVQFPAAPPFLQLHTATQLARVNASGKPLVNDVIQHDMLAPDGVTPAAGALLVVAAPNFGAYPLTAFVGEGFPAPKAAVDLNNLFLAGTGASAEVPAGQILTLTEFRGLTCPGLTDHKLLRFRRAPAHEETPPITELESAPRCFSADTLCDSTVDLLDAQRVLATLNRRPGQCAFNGDLDVVADNVINILDIQSVLNHFGESAPFQP